MRGVEASGESLAGALEILPGITALIGGGGKTTLMLRLARELSGKGSVVVSTSTRIYPPVGIPLVTRAEDVLLKNGCVCVGTPAENGKLAGPEVSFDELAAAARFVLVEADGSRGRPFKAHAAHEPVIPVNARVIALCGASGFGKSIEQSVHRAELFAREMSCGVGDEITPELYAKAVRAHMPCGTVVMNQVDTGLELALAQRFAREYGGRVVAVSLRDEKPVRMIWR